MDRQDAQDWGKGRDENADAADWYRFTVVPNLMLNICTRLRHGNTRTTWAIDSYSGVQWDRPVQTA